MKTKLWKDLGGGFCISVKASDSSTYEVVVFGPDESTYFSKRVPKSNLVQSTLDDAVEHGRRNFKGALEKLERAKAEEARVQALLEALS